MTAIFHFVFTLLITMESATMTGKLQYVDIIMHATRIIMSTYCICWSTFGYDVIINGGVVGFYPTPVRGALFEILTTRAASTGSRLVGLVGLVTVGG